MISLQSIDAVALNTFNFVVAVCMYVSFFLGIVGSFSILAIIQIERKIHARTIGWEFGEVFGVFHFSLFFRYFVALYHYVLRLLKVNEIQTMANVCWSV